MLRVRRFGNMVAQEGTHVSQGAGSLGATTGYLPNPLLAGIVFFLELGDLGESPAWDFFLYVVFPVSWTANLHSYK